MNVKTKDDVIKILKEKEEILRRYKVKKVSLFGSFVRGEQSDESDIDLLVEFESPISIFEHVHLINELEQIFGKKVEVVSVKALRSELQDVILKEAVEV